MMHASAPLNLEPAPDADWRPTGHLANVRTRCSPTDSQRQRDSNYG